MECARRPICSRLCACVEQNVASPLGVDAASACAGDKCINLEDRGFWIVSLLSLPSLPPPPARFPSCREKVLLLALIMGTAGELVINMSNRRGGEGGGPSSFGRS